MVKEVGYAREISNIKRTSLRDGGNKGGHEDIQTPPDKSGRARKKSNIEKCS